MDFNAIANVSKKISLRMAFFSFMLMVTLLFALFSSMVDFSAHEPGIAIKPAIIALPSFNETLDTQIHPSWNRLFDSLFSMQSNPHLFGSSCQPSINEAVPSNLEKIREANAPKACPDPEWSSFDEHHVLRIHEDVGLVNVTVTRQDPHPPGTEGYGIDFAPPPEWKTYSTPLTV